MSAARTTTLLTIPVLLFTLLLAGITQAQGNSLPRTITVTGEGEVTIAPDMARVSMAVSERDTDIAKAQARAAEVTSAVLKLLDELGVDRKYVNTTSASIRPDYRWNRQTEQQELQGYIAERRIEVELRKLEDLARLVEGATDAGVNQLSPPVLDSTERRSANRSALVAASDDARKNAEALAKAIGTELGDVVTLNAGGAGGMPPPMPMLRAAMADSAESSVQSYNAGDLTFRATVTATYAIR